MARERWGLSAADFLWAVGIENTFIPHTRSGHRRLDEYELLDHYRKWRTDLALARGMARTAEALRSAQPESVLVHVEDVGLERASSASVADVAAYAQMRRLLPLDLACGKVTAGHPACDWLIEHGATEPELHD